jgi:hypothetical protein
VTEKVRAELERLKTLTLQEGEHGNTILAQYIERDVIIQKV